MDLITVAQAAAAVLAPVLPYLVKGGEEALKEVGKKTGGAAWEAGKSLWSTLKDKIAGRPTEASDLDVIIISRDFKDIPFVKRMGRAIKSRPIPQACGLLLLYPGRV